MHFIVGIALFIVSREIAKRSDRWTRVGLPMMLAILACLFLVIGFVRFVVKLGESVWR